MKRTNDRFSWFICKTRYSQESLSDTFEKSTAYLFKLNLTLWEVYLFTDFSWFCTYQKDISWHTLRHWFQNINAIWLYINKYLMNSVELMESFELHESLFSADWLICLLLDVVLPRKKCLTMKPLQLITHHTRTDPISHTWKCCWLNTRNNYP